MTVSGETLAWEQMGKNLGKNWNKGQMGKNLGKNWNKGQMGKKSVNKYSLKKSLEKRYERGLRSNIITNQSTVKSQPLSSYTSINSLNNQSRRTGGRRLNRTCIDRWTKPLRFKKINFVSQEGQNATSTPVSRSEINNSLLMFFKNQLTNCCNKLTTSIQHLFKSPTTLVLLVMFVYCFWYNKNLNRNLKKITNPDSAKINWFVGTSRRCGGWLFRAFKAWLMKFCTTLSTVYCKFKIQLTRTHDVLVIVYRQCKIWITMIHQNSDICYWQSLIVSKVVVPLVLGVLSTLLTALLLEVLIAVSWVIAPQLPQLPFLLEPLLNDLKTILIKGVSLVVSVWEHPVFLLFFSLYVCRYVGATGVIIGLYCFGIAGLESDTQLILVLIIISGYDVTLWVHYLHWWAFDFENPTHREIIEQNNTMLSWFQVTTFCWAVWAFWVSYPACCSLPAWIVLFLFLVPVLYAFDINCANDENN